MIEIDRDWLATHPLPQPDAGTDKNKRGRVLVAGGSETVPGALLLTGEAAFRAGAGKVVLATVASAAPNLGLRMPEAAVAGLPANRDGELAAAAGAALRNLLKRCDAFVLGPGMSPKADTEGLADALMAHSADIAWVVDAAMIPAFAHRDAAARGMNGRVVLTPHSGEMAQLLGCDERAVLHDPAAAVATAADRLQATVALKASETWIAAPGVETLHYRGGGPGLATAGSGDVLAGIIGGLLARGTPPQVAAGSGVWLHGEAGRVLASRIGPLGFLARELLGELRG
jgi:ADP-dependent NAD(P)H-hydrate dehydratase